MHMQPIRMLCTNCMHVLSKAGFVVVVDAVGQAMRCPGIALHRE